MNIRNKAIFPLARTHGEPGWERSGRFFFIPMGLTLSSQAITDSSGTDLTVIDEVGPLELGGGGFRPGLDAVIRMNHPALIVVRRSLLTQFCDNIAESFTIYDSDDPNSIHLLIDDIRMLKP
jgi:nucleoside-triphosphatase THEP1